MKYFAVSDCHGFFNELMTALDTAGFDINNPEHTLVVCGDLFDRGSQPREIFDFVKSLPKERFIYIRGNHEDLLMDCLSEIYKGYNPSNHHYHNKTVQTIFDFCGITRQDFWEKRGETILAIKKNIAPLIDFINERSINYYETGTHVFVHGWIPCEIVGGRTYGDYSRNDNWRDANEMQWREARWINGMYCAKYWGIVEPDKTIVCGHWNAGWGHYMYDDESNEDNNEPFYSDGIIAIDACTALSKIVNCIVIEE